MDKKLEKKLQVRNLQVSFRTNGGKVQAVRNISFDLHKGETLAIVGESGSGKSVTSKAILGILADNAIVEGGEILYDGQDLLKISEDDFYRLRGDKVAMIFQDPLSSLNPIMRIGKQLTEAMLLKGKARQRSCKVNYQTKLALLEKYMKDAVPEKAEEIKHKCELFRRIEQKHIALEHAYNLAYEAAQEALVEVEHVMFLMEKNAFKDTSSLREIKEFSSHALNPYVVAEDRAGELTAQVSGLMSGISAQQRSGDYSQAQARLSKIRVILQEAVDKTKPDFFALGYHMVDGGAEAPGTTVAEQNAFYNKQLKERFLEDFETVATQGIARSDENYLAKRQQVITALDKAITQLREGNVDAFKPTAAELMKQVTESIDPIDIVKDSAACTFAGSMKAFLERYGLGVRTNSRKEAKYQKQLRRSEAKAKRGKEWKVAAPSTIDLELVKQNMLSLMERLKEHYEARNAAEPSENKKLKTDRVIAYLQENAAGMAFRISKRAAKNKALKLMEEVGISEPRKRYRQYPFEFSGGMRQRIVIAIALAANPDILICDEPTTALDVTIQAQILELINKLKRERNLSIIFITHDLGVVANMADRIAVMYAGKIVEYGASEEIFYAPAHPYTWALLSSMPDLDSKDKLEAIPGTPPNMIYPPKGDAFADRNRYAMKIDFEMQPPPFPITDTHWAATWLLHPNAPKVEPPKMVMERITKMKARMEEEAHA